MAGANLFSEGCKKVPRRNCGILRALFADMKPLSVMNLVKMRMGSFLRVAVAFVLVILLGQLQPEPVQSADKDMVAVEILYEGYPLQVQVAASTVAGVLSVLEIPYAPDSRVFPALNTMVAAGTRIEVENKRAVSLDVDGETLHFRTFARTVEAFFEETEITLNPEDELSEPLEASLQANTVLRLDRIAQTTEQREEAIPFDTEEVEDDELLLGETAVRAAGEEGVRQLTYEIRLRNGEKEGETLIEEKVVIPPSARIIARGTRQPVIAAPPPPEPAPEPEPPAAEQAEISSGARQGIASWYRASGMVAAHRDFPNGSKVRVTNLSNGNSVVVTVTNYGPQAWTGREIDLSHGAFSELAPLGAGLIRNTQVELL